MNVLMVGVDKERIGGMWSVAEVFINSADFNEKVNLTYVSTSTCGSKFKRLLKMFSGYAQILKVLLTKRIDLVHIHMAERGSVYRKGLVLKVAKFFGKKVVVQMHAGPIMKWYGDLSKNKQRCIAKILNSADRMLVLGEYWGKQLSAIVDKNRISVLYNGSDCPKTNKYNPDGDSIVYLGLLKKGKGIYDLIDAMESINDRLPSDVVLYLCGTDEEGAIQKIITKNGLGQRIKMLGWISKQDRLALFEHTQMCVLPSYFEALSMTVIESMCYGIPMVTTNISTMPELLGNEIPLVTPGDSHALGEQILKWSLDKELRMRISDIEYNRAKEYFSVENNVASTLDIYKKVLNSGDVS